MESNNHLFDLIKEVREDVKEVRKDVTATREMIHDDRESKALWHGRYLAIVASLGIIGGALWDFVKRKFLG